MGRRRRCRARTYRQAGRHEKGILSHAVCVVYRVGWVDGSGKRVSVWLYSWRRGGASMAHVDTSLWE